MKILLTFILLMMTQGVCAADAALIFHVAMKDDNQQVIGVTVDNKVSPENHRYFVTYILMDDKCRPGAPLTTELSGILPDRKTTVHIPVETPFTYYRIIDFFVYNNMGIPSSVKDETRDIILDRDPEYSQSCSKLRRR
ncbi:hypothetical protein [Morganella morganii]|uniref:hypothetical protein n=1 Tax=Morganella morganii TaxID=582 RepID=UPI0021D3181E|nr:hypothetical protein [Morganella morganii]MCU6377193.1 hypothetical protein [Morganella morganii]